MEISEAGTSNGGLDDVVTEGVLHDLAETIDIIVVEFFDQRVLRLLVSEDEELFDDVGGELVAGEIEDLALDGVPDQWDSFLARGSIEEILNNVVGEGVSSEDGDVGGDGSDELGGRYNNNNNMMNNNQQQQYYGGNNNTQQQQYGGYQQQQQAYSGVSSTAPTPAW